MKYSLKSTDMRERIKIYFVDPDWLCICIFSWIAHYHIHSIYAHVWTAFIPSHGKKVCGCHRASCGSFLLGWHASVVLCHGASWDIMWAYQVATRVSGGAWVTEGLHILKLYHFLPLVSDSGRNGVAPEVWECAVETLRMVKCAILDKKKKTLF